MCINSRTRTGHICKQLETLSTVWRMVCKKRGCYRLNSSPGKLIKESNATDTKAHSSKHPFVFDVHFLEMALELTTECVIDIYTWLQTYRGMITVPKCTLANTRGALMGLHGWSWMTAAPILTQVSRDYPVAFKPLPSSQEISAISCWHVERPPILTLGSLCKTNLPVERAVKSPQIKSDLPPITPLPCTSADKVLYLNRARYLCALPIDPEQHQRIFTSTYLITSSPNLY